MLYSRIIYIYNPRILRTRHLVLFREKLKIPQKELFFSVFLFQFKKFILTLKNKFFTKFSSFFE